MKAQQLLRYATQSFGPEAMKVIGQAFDEAWASIAGKFTTHSAETERLRLATIILAVATDDSRDVEALKACRARANEP
jgi:hypothetical protein